MQRLHRFDPSPCAFPPPRLPLLAPPRRRSLGAAAATAPDDRRFQHHARGRHALRAALLSAGADSLLLPAYHCRTMVDPAVDLGLTVQTYALQADLRPDMASVAAALKGLQGRRVALLVTHYFGFLQAELGALRSLCDAAGAVLIEDASHCFLLDAGLAAGPRLQDGLGQAADIGIASPYKFLPSPDGGLLWVRGERRLPPPPTAMPWRSELRAWLQFARTLLQAEPSGAAKSRASGGAAKEWLEPLLSPSARYLGPERGHAALRLSRWVMRHVRVDAISAARRANYTRFAEALQGLRGARPLFPHLGADTVPYMFPLLLDAAEPHFSRLKALGMPIWRWDEMLETDCPVSQTYRQHLLHLPCHDALGAGEMNWMINCLRAEFGTAPR